VGVDGDSDGTRNPQDVDDAALATAVYLCSGDDDLSTEQGQRASVYRYNHSNDYVDLVLQIMQAYMDGDFSAVPTSTVPAGVILPVVTETPSGGKGGGKGNDGGGTGGGKETPSGKPTPTPTQTPTQTPTTTTATPTPTPTPTPTKEPTKEPTVVPTTPVPTIVPTTLPPLPTATITAPLTYAQARAQCLARGISELDVPALTACIAELLNP
jgi:hypothetical protein